MPDDTATGPGAGPSTDRPLRVLAKVNELGLGGTQLNALDVAAAGRSRGVETTLVGYRETLPADGGSILERADELGVAVELLDQGDRAGWPNRRRRARELDALADRLDVDLVHAYGAWSARQAYWGPCRYGRRPLVLTVYEMYLPDTVYRRPQLIIGTRYLLEDHQHPRGNVWLVSPPVDLGSDRPGASDGTSAPPLDSVPDGLLRIVMVCRLNDDMKSHGVGVAMRTMELLDRDDVVLVIVGGGPAEERLRAEGAQVNARLGRDAVVFVGSMTDPRPAYDIADIVIGMGGSAARTLAFATPLVANGERGWSLRFAPETSATLFRQSFWSDDVIDDAEALLAAQLRPLLDDPDERRRLGEYGRSFAEQNFGLEAMTDRTVEIYRTAIDTYTRREWFADLTTEAVNAARSLGQELRR